MLLWPGQGLLDVAPYRHQQLALLLELGSALGPGGQPSADPQQALHPSLHQGESGGSSRGVAGQQEAEQRGLDGSGGDGVGQEPSSPPGGTLVLLPTPDLPAVQGWEEQGSVLQVGEGQGARS